MYTSEWVSCPEQIPIEYQICWKANVDNPTDSTDGTILLSAPWKTVQIYPISHKFWNIFKNNLGNEKNGAMHSAILSHWPKDCVYREDDPLVPSQSFMNFHRKATSLNGSTEEITRIGSILLGIMNESHIYYGQLFRQHSEIQNECTLALVQRIRQQNTSINYAIDSVYSSVKNPNSKDKIKKYLQESQVTESSVLSMLYKLCRTSEFTREVQVRYQEIESNRNNSEKYWEEID